jgi:hypothetical protein
VFFAINFSFLSGCLYRTLSEPLGISFGLIAFALHWPSIANRNLTHYALATFFLALALLTRAVPATILTGLDHNSGHRQIVVGPPGFADGPRRLAAVCTKSLGNDVLSVRPIRKAG